MALRPVGSEEPEYKQAPIAEPPNQAAMMGLQMMALGLKTLSQRALLAVYNSFAVLMFGVAAYLWYAVLPTLTWEQITGCTIFNLFTLGMVKLVRRI